MFAIGGAEWPGISKLVEEMGEVGQVVGKLMATHGESKHWDADGDLRDRLTEEVGDLLAAVWFVAEMNDLQITERAQYKYSLFGQWHRERRARA